LTIARDILAQAWPILLGQFASIAYAVIDTVMTGHASPADLAAMGLGASIYGSVVMALTGVVTALNPIVAHHYGARRWEAIGSSYLQGMWLALFLSALGFPILVFPELWLAYLEAAPDVRDLVTRYLRLLGFALPASLLFRATYSFNVAVSRPKVMMAVQVVGLVLKVVLNYALIFGKLGLPRLGAVGCGLASLIVLWALFGMGWAYTHLDPGYRRYAIGWGRPRWDALREHVRLGVPIGLAYALESTSFSFMTLLTARLGTSVTGGHQIVSNVAALSFQIPLALSLATATLTAHALGAGSATHARRVGFTGVRVAVTTAVLTAFSCWLLRREIVGLYTSDAAVTGVALSLIGYFVAFHVFDALQGITAFVLRAYKVTIVPTVIYAVALWGLGLVGGYAVAFHSVLGEPRGAPGLWLMQSVALALTSLLLVACYLWVLRKGRPTRRSGMAATERST
jgi:MATE family multidrug resistance protein